MLRRRRREAGFEGVLVTPGPNLVYFTGYSPIAITERITMLVISASRDPALILPILERPDGEKASAAPALSLHDWRDGDDPYAATAALLDSTGRYAVSDSAWAMHVLGLQQALPGSSYVSMTSALPMLRAIKDAAELDRLAAAGAAADAALEEIVQTSFAGRRESEVGADLAALLRKHGHPEVDFTVVGSGPNGVRAAQQAGFDAVRPGVACQEIDRAARKVIADAGYGDHFIHRTGHGIGLTTHEPPYMAEGETLPLQPGMCFSIEPGIYLPGRFGVRIEDIVTVTADGGRRLNNTDRQMRIVA